MNPHQRHPLEAPNKPTIPWPGPKESDLDTKEFNRIWDCIKTWDINVPEVYQGYGQATGNHVIAILIALGLRSIRDYNTKEYTS